MPCGLTPQERQLIDELFDRLARLEAAPRDAEAAAAIEAGLRRAPHAVYALVQTTLVQDEALRKAAERIQELEAQQPAPAATGGFLDTARSAIWGGRIAGSVPSVPAAGGSPWNRTAPRMDAPQGFGQPQQPVPPQQPSRAGGFLGTAASAAAGVIGGALLMDGIRSMMGGHGAQSASHDIGNRNGLWGDQSTDSLSREAGAGDIGRQREGGERHGLFDNASDDALKHD